jgi:hypothetical protein
VCTYYVLITKFFSALPRCLSLISRRYSEDSESGRPLKKPNTPIGRLDEELDGKNEKNNPQKPTMKAEDPYAPFPDSKNPKTGEIGGPRGPEPTRYGDWSYKGRAIDF